MRERTFLFAKSKLKIKLKTKEKTDKSERCKMRERGQKSCEKRQEVKSKKRN